MITIYVCLREKFFKYRRVFARDAKTRLFEMFDVQCSSAVVQREVSGRQIGELEDD